MNQMEVVGEQQPPPEYKLEIENHSANSVEVRLEKTTSNNAAIIRHVKKSIQKYTSRKRFKKLCKTILQRKENDDDGIEEHVPTTLDTKMIEEYNKEQSVITEPNLNISPHYIHHDAMKEKELKYLFARRSCHLPGNSWWQDWIQFICNNHPLFGLCLHHRLHPLSLYDRISILISSISFGLIATNLVYLHFVMTDKDFQEDIIRFNLEIWEGFNLQAVLTSGVATLLFFNGILHVLFDISMWHLSAATCCHQLENHQAIKKFGSYAASCIALACITLATLVVLFRASYQLNEEDKDNEWVNMLKIETTFAVLGYILQLSATYFIISPMIVTIMFSGVLGCIPGLGGRPKDIQRILDSIMEERIKYFTERLSKDEEENSKEDEYYLL